MIHNEVISNIFYKPVLARVDSTVLLGRVGSLG